jgi:hypothetical protein
VDEAAVTETVRALLACLVDWAPGGLPACSLSGVSAFGAAERYVGVLHSLTSDDQDPDAYVKSNVARFLWDYLANRTADVRSPQP